MLRGKNAVVFAARGAVCGAVARAFARHGARLLLSGPNREPLETVLRRTPTLEEVGEVAAFLVSDAASALAAQTVTVTC